MTEETYAAFLRCSEEELQNPELSLERQLHNCGASVARWGGHIVVVYYEIETGSSSYERRGTRTNLAGYNLPIPRAGGLHELVRDAQRSPRPFDRVVCESINRLARNPAVTFSVEEQLLRAGVLLHCTDEPFEESFGSIVLRHLNVGLARGYLFNLKKASREGVQAGIRKGWHMGGAALYGYQFARQEHPNPHKRRQGLTRSTLDLDPVRATVVRLIFDQYLHGQGGLDEICGLLNSDLARFPPPVPTDPHRRSLTWKRSTIWAILHNPKYTGYQVWNRRASKTGHGRSNQPAEWTWSEEPSHPAIVTVEEFKRVDAAARHKRRSRRTDPPTPTPTTRAPYLLRGRIACACGLRMIGCRRKHTIRYYMCEPSRMRGNSAAPDHPHTVYVPERALLDGVTDFLRTAIYGPDRAGYWMLALQRAQATDNFTAPARARVEELEAAVADLEGRLRRQVLTLEDEQISPAAREPIVHRIAELRHEIAERQAALAALREQLPASPADPQVVADLLATLPIRDGELRELPEQELRDIFASLDLAISYDYRRHIAELALTLAARGRQGEGLHLWSAPAARSRPDPRSVRTPDRRDHAAGQGSARPLGTAFR